MAGIRLAPTYPRFGETSCNRAPGCFLLCPGEHHGGNTSSEEMGADAVEVDVHLTYDGVPVVIHDREVDRTTTGSGSVVDLTFDELKKLDAGSWISKRFRNERIPSPKGSKFDVPYVPGEGLDHIGFAVENVEEKFRELVAKGAEPTEIDPVSTEG